MLGKKSQQIQDYLSHEHAICNFGIASAKSGEIEYLELGPEVYTTQDSPSSIRLLVREHLIQMQRDEVENLIIVLNSEAEPVSHDEAYRISKRVLFEISVAAQICKEPNLPEIYLENLIKNLGDNDYFSDGRTEIDPIVRHKVKTEMRGPFDTLFAFACNSLYPRFHPRFHPRFFPFAALVLTSRQVIEDQVVNSPVTVSKINSKAYAGLVCPFSTREEFFEHASLYTPIQRFGMDGKVKFRTSIPKDISEQDLAEIQNFKKRFYEFPLRTSS